MKLGRSNRQKNKKKVLILSADQFGYLTDTLKYCQYAADDFEITYVGWDYNKLKIEIQDVTIKYVSRKGNLLLRNLRLLQAFHREIKNDYDVVFANYFRGISLLKIFNYSVKFIVDIRTLCVNNNRITRELYNTILKFEISFFRHISIISEGVAGKLQVKNYYLLPLGGECFSSEPKSFEKLSLLYVGTLKDRNLIDCVKGFHLFLKTAESANIPSVFTIVGDSPGNELREIKEYITNHQLADKIILPGSIPQNLLKPYFEEANVGISYIPLRSYYEFQPPTKTYEYLISGLPVIATATYANAHILEDENSGVLIQDSAESFCSGLRDFSSMTHIFNSNSIKMCYEKCKWRELVKTKFVSIVEQVGVS